jgi:hypothetical protein
VLTKPKVPRHFGRQKAKNRLPHVPATHKPLGHHRMNWINDCNKKQTIHFLQEGDSETGNEWCCLVETQLLKVVPFRWIEIMIKRSVSLVTEQSLSRWNVRKRAVLLWRGKWRPVFSNQLFGKYFPFWPITTSRCWRSWKAPNCTVNHKKVYKCFLWRLKS